MIRYRPVFSLKWLKGIFSSQAALPLEIRRARGVIEAIGEGGVPLNPAKINEIARDLGLEVRRSAPVEDTIQRIHSAILRSRQ